MILLAGLASLTVITVTSLLVANSIDRRHTPAPKPPRLTKEAIAEKRRLLERQRSGLFTTPPKEPGGMWLATGGNIDRLKEVDRELLALADEEREP